ncbi:MAG: DUF1819 family protein [Anaerolineae bacterium]|nr:DUF1819 family protein [Anaerolineae bacterium]
MTTTLRRQTYNTSFAGKGARLPDVKQVLQAVATGQTLEQIRAAVIDQDLLDCGTRKSRETVWHEIYRRYLSGREAAHSATLARFASRCANSAAVDLVLFYEYCQVDALLYELTAHCTYELYQNARTTIDKVDINEWLSQQEATHPEISRWSPMVRGRLVRGYLATIRDFGLVTGTKQKEFYKLYIPREAFIYALYHQKDRGLEDFGDLTAKALIQSLDWRLFLLTERDVLFMLDDAARGGFVHFRQAGDIYDLRFIYNDLHEVVNVLIGG